MEIDVALERETGVDRSFWVCIALAYMEFLTEREASILFLPCGFSRLNFVEIPELSSCFEWLGKLVNWIKASIQLQVVTYNYKLRSLELNCSATRVQAAVRSIYCGT